MSTPVITIFVRHKPTCKHAANEFSKRCDCRKHFRWIQDGKQYRKQADTRSWEQAEKHKRELEDFLATGNKPAAMSKTKTAPVTVVEATAEWIAFRKQTRPGIDDSKPMLMAAKLNDWTAAHGIVFLKSLTPSLIMQFRSSLPFRTGDSSSLKVHWSVLCGFFGWAEFMYKIESPIPTTKGGANPQFQIRYKQRKVTPPTGEEVGKVLAACSGKVRIFALLMRHTGMALADAVQFGQGNGLQDGTLIKGNRRKTDEGFRVRIPAGLADSLTPGMFAEGAAFYRMHLCRAIKDAKVKMTPHGFRHFRVSEWRAAGVSFEDISEFVGTSPIELRRTYAHLTTKGEHRLDEVQRRADSSLTSDQPTVRVNLN